MWIETFREHHNVFDDEDFSWLKKLKNTWTYMGIRFLVPTNIVAETNPFPNSEPRYFFL